MAIAGCARSVFRSGSFRNAAAKLTTETKAARSSFRLPNQKPPSSARFLLRSPVEMSFCVESLLPLHSATSSALLTSMLAVSRPTYCWLSQAGNDDV
ncbi:hypothetical protein AAC387_Pa06g0314 [Persea americana]